jgi:hypothetical protein
MQPDAGRCKPSQSEAQSEAQAEALARLDRMSPWQALRQAAIAIMILSIILSIILSVEVQSLRASIFQSTLLIHVIENALVAPSGKVR